MAQTAIPEQISQHLEAALALSKQELLHRILEEANLCVERYQSDTAAILVGITLEELGLIKPVEADQAYRKLVKVWHELRAHLASKPGLKRETVAAMVSQTKTLLDKLDKLSDTPASDTLARQVPGKVAGKYKFVPTSVQTFIQRKRSDLARED